MKFLVCLSLMLSAVAQGNNQLRSRTLDSPAEEDYDCDNGCDLKGPAVCGEDGFTYRNGCLATCQGVVVEKYGACPGDPLRKADSDDEEGIVDLETMNRFKEEKFKLVGKRKLLPLDANFHFDETDEKARKDKGPKKGKIRARRLEYTGYEYEAEYDDSEDSSDLKELPPFDPMPENPKPENPEPGNPEPENPEPENPEPENPEPENPEPENHRDLMVFPPDTRHRVYDWYAFPHRIIGEMDFDWNRNGRHEEEGGCTGTIVSKDSVLTAGHCLYDFRYTKDWTPHTRFAPGRYRNSAGATVEPYGFYYWREMTTYEKWTSDGTRSYDMGVVKYWPKNGQGIGDRLGYAGFQSVSDGNDGKLDHDYIKGYPYDMPDGTLWRSGTCNHWCFSSFLWWCIEDHLSKHRCDTKPAMSGSAVMTSSGYIHGIHVAGGSNYNVAVLLHGRNVDKLKEWAGR